jgi:hypothetical protein
VFAPLDPEARLALQEEKQALEQKLLEVPKLTVSFVSFPFARLASAVADSTTSRNLLSFNRSGSNSCAHLLATPAFVFVRSSPAADPLVPFQPNDSPRAWNRDCGLRPMPPLVGAPRHSSLGRLLFTPCSPLVHPVASPSPIQKMLLSLPCSSPCSCDGARDDGSSITIVCAGEITGAD